MSDSQNQYPPPGPQDNGAQFQGQPGPQYGGPQGGPQYGGPQGQPQYPPMRPDEERTWALLAHVGTIVLGFIAPLIVMLVKGNNSRFVRDHSVESLNFQITVLIGYVVSAVLSIVIIGIFTFTALWILALVFAILATIAASKGLPYKYPFAIRLVK